MLAAKWRERLPTKTGVSAAASFFSSCRCLFISETVIDGAACLPAAPRSLITAARVTSGCRCQGSYTRMKIVRQAKVCLMACSWRLGCAEVWLLRRRLAPPGSQTRRKTRGWRRDLAGDCRRQHDLDGDGAAAGSRSMRCWLCAFRSRGWSAIEERPFSQVAMLQAQWRT